jgi:hypothetical protein
LVVNNTSTGTVGNPFTLLAGSTQNTSTGATAFEQQLSSALADSLQKLGVAPGEVNITIRNTGNQAATRQIVISYNALNTNTITPAVTGGTPGVTGEIPVQPAETQTPTQTSWAPYTGPRDTRDAMPAGGGNTTANGSPVITLNATPAANQYNYSGPAARNPYFTTPSNPLREGYVAGFQSWFTEAFITGGKDGPVPANKTLFTTQEGADEALRLVQEHFPDAEIVQHTWGGGPFSASRPSFHIKYGGERLINAGGILHSYYNQGYGVTTASDGDLRRWLDLA